MSKFDELVAKLEELFELDKADLDFGIHRIIKSKHKQVQDYLTKRLPETVKEALGGLVNASGESELESLRQKIRDEFGKRAFADNDNLIDEAARNDELGKQYITLLESPNQAVSGERLEADIFSHLYEFFSRYYEDGDFLSLRRHSNKQKYSIPYNGEEVVLHWANKDQYYIKSSEEMKDYAFTLDGDGQKRRVKFKLTRMDAVQNNNKATRAFVIDDEVEIEATDDTLVIPFHFKEFDKKPTAKKNLGTLTEALEEKLSQEWRELMWANDSTYTGKDSRTILGKHLQNYTKKNTSDYFIHKDLGGFLREELDFYIKNEVMFLDDVDNRPADYLAGEIRKIKAIRKVGKDLVDFLAQFEDFQKKLWLKKKFVLETNYCITLDLIPKKLYPEIVANDRQWREWKKLCFLGEGVRPSEDALKEHQFIVVDTTFFTGQFKYNILETLDDIDAQTDGLLINSENFQALSLLHERYKEQVKCVYIDPPYNSGGDDFPYKDSYRNSSWLAMLHDRLLLSNTLMDKRGVCFMHIDDKDEDNRVSHRLMNLLEDTFGPKNYLDNLIWVKNTTHNDAKTFSHNHEYILAQVHHEAS